MEGGGGEGEREKSTEKKNTRAARHPTLSKERRSLPDQDRGEERRRGRLVKKRRSVPVESVVLLEPLLPLLAYACVLRVPELLCLRYAVVLVGGVDDTRSEAATAEACARREKGGLEGGRGEGREERSGATHAGAGGEGGSREVERG